ncbi:MFS transporter [Nonomuraea sediminis]|uniref:MFS transporter n=1 Tax=Nonomuraea sediminis TaxID=2835864 RepID=UPI001BDC1352|nr:MFS transporter [Nonomuraea sediminis]
MRARLPFRLTRSAAFAAVCVGLGALAHVVGGGSSPGPAAVVVALLAAFALALAVSGRERSTAAINVALVGAQVVLHELFAITGSLEASSGLDGLRGALLGRFSPGGISQVADGHAQGLSVGLGMWVAHLLATLVTGWWLARGEAALWSLLRRLGRRLTLLRPLPRIQPVRRAVPYFYLLAVPMRAPVEHSVSRRGPPLPA